ncbi:coiled-coil domain-containing protein 28B-like [Lineus longissimus]|uniref:coiled-coil domain-containing protein 28B-like n=1 Tax=Lineus longissimus TaxID=88925 RepID=UPI002B4D3B0C
MSQVQGPPPASLPVSSPTKPGPSHTVGGKKSGKKGKREGDSTRPCKEHTFLTDVADVREMEHGLLQLLEDFHSGKLQAFGQDCTFDKMDMVREQQEKLTRLHFELDTQQEIQGMDTDQGREMAQKNMDQLMEKLQELNNSILNLQKTENPLQLGKSPKHPAT